MNQRPFEKKAAQIVCARLLQISVNHSAYARKIQSFCALNEQGTKLALKIKDESLINKWQSLSYSGDSELEKLTAFLKEYNSHTPASHFQDLLSSFQKLSDHPLFHDELAAFLTNHLACYDLDTVGSFVINCAAKECFHLIKPYQLMLEIFLAKVKNDEKLPGVVSSRKMFLSLLKIYEHFKYISVKLEQWSWLSFLSNSLLNLGSKLKSITAPYITFWELSLNTELEFQEKASEKTSSMISLKAERLVLALIDSKQCRKALAILLRSVKAVYEIQNIGHLVTKQPLYVICENQNYRKLVPIFARLSDEISDSDIENMDTALMETIIASFGRTTNQKKIALLDKLMKKLWKRLPYQEYPLRLLQSLLYHFRSTDGMYSQLLIVYPEILSSIERRELGRDSELSSISPAIEAATLCSLIIGNQNPYGSMLECVKKINSFDLENLGRLLLHSGFMDLYMHFLEFLEMQGCHEIRANLLLRLLSDERDFDTSLNLSCMLAKSYLSLGYTGGALRELSLLTVGIANASNRDDSAKVLTLLLDIECCVEMGLLDGTKHKYEKLIEIVNGSDTMSSPISAGRQSGETIEQFQERVILRIRASNILATLNAIHGINDEAIVLLQNSIRFLQSYLKKSHSRTTVFPVISILIDCCLRVSRLFDKAGLVKDCCYYIKEARKAAEGVKSKGRLLEILALEGRVNVRLGNLPQAYEVLTLCEEALEEVNIKDIHFLHLVQSLVLYLQRRSLYSEENVYYDMSEVVFREILERINSVYDCGTNDSNQLSEQFSRLAISKLKQAESGHEKEIRAYGLELLRNEIIRSRIYSLGLQGVVSKAAEVLQTYIKTSAFNSIRDSILCDCLRARNNYLMVKEALIANPVYGVLQDSALSIPSSVEHKNVGSKSASRSRSNGLSLTIITWLKEAYAIITQNISMALKVCTSTELREISKLLNDITILLSGIGSEVCSSSNFKFSETTKGLSSLQERSMLRMRSKVNNGFNWKVDDALSFHTPHGSLDDILPDDLPSDWLVISISISGTGNLLVTRYEKNRRPLLISLPLNRHNSRDADEQSFSFDDGLSLFQKIIKASNSSSQLSRTSAIQTKEDRHNWWKERFALDKQLKELLKDTEYSWFGGFRGIFNRTMIPMPVVEKFESAFYSILNKYLPSRKDGKRGKRGLKKAGGVYVHCRIFELFLGLDLSMDDPGPIEDLLYFVLDILQFHGEQNAYDELDIDQIVVDLEELIASCLTMLNEYKQISECKVFSHTVLVLDNECLQFPWESLPLLRKCSVSRVLSCSMLKGLLQDRGGKFTISNPLFSYILNPAGDLLKTQERFQSKFESLNWWHGTIQSKPTESELVEILEEDCPGQVFVYMGHGGGEQYIRSASVKSLGRCCPSLLLGCSSGVLENSGDYEPCGTPINYLLGGCPLLVANMWDVTDKDIDLFSTAVLTRWGAFEENSNVDICTAVMQSRDECTLKYLNGGAPVVYGLPLMLEKN